MPPAPKIALFGGTFDPPHLGHLAIAEETVRACALDRVIFVPCRVSPHKGGSPAAASAEQRLEMLGLCVADKPWAEVSTVELERPGPSYSWETAESFAAERPDAEWFWILGVDQWRALDRWAHPEKLRQRVTFIVFPRGGQSPEPRSEYRSVFLEFTHPASATGIRTLLAENGDATDLLLPEVARYIAQHALYQKEATG